MKALGIVVGMTVLLIAQGWAQDAKTPAAKRDNKDRVEVAGKLVCIGCTLEKGAGANAQCTLHAKHAQGMLLEDGTLWTFVDNAKGHIVLTNAKLKDKEVKIIGWKFPKSHYLEVSKYQVKEGDKWVAYDYCKNCGFEAGDNADTDLCGDCKPK